MLLLSWGTPGQAMLDRLSRKLPSGWTLTTDVACLPDACGILVIRGRVEEVHLQQARRLQFIQLTRMDYDMVDFDAASAIGVPIICRPLAHWSAVAEHTMLLILALAKRLLDADRAVRDRLAFPAKESEVPGLPYSFAYNWPHLSGLVTLSGKTLGLVGMGHIGIEVAKRARAFDLEVLYWRRTRLPAYCEGHFGVHYRSLPELLKTSDFVSLHLPLTDGTRHLIGEEQLRLMKPAAYLVNTARGDVVDEAALIRALAAGSIAGAALDVYAKEPLPEGHPLTVLPNVILTPHCASGYDTLEQSQEYIADEWVSAAQDVAQGRTFGHVVNGIRGMPTVAAS